MEKRKNSLSAIKICRFCLVNNESLTNIYDRNKKPKNDIPLSLKILSCISIEVFPSDKMPLFICQRCRFFMDLFHDFKEVCRRTDERIMQFIQEGTALEAITWPRLLSKVHNTEFKIKAKPKVMKTVTEGGTTVQVTSQDGSDSDDEEDENVYNIKIGDDSHEGQKCIKVVTSKSEDKEKSQPSKEFSSVSRLTRHLRTHATGRLFPCKYCEKSFLRSHHYTRHLRIAHRDVVRSARAPQDQYRCEQCEECFESQDELIYHSAIHATQNLTCPLCQEKFDDVDAVTAHIKSHVNGTEFMCELCELIFTSKEKLDNHLTSAHAEELDHDESMEDMDAEEDEDDNGFNVKEEDDHMVVEIKKPDGYLLPEAQSTVEHKPDNTASEESEADPEGNFEELPSVDAVSIVKKEVAKELEAAPAPPDVVRVAAKPAEVADTARDSQTASILRKAEEVKRKAQQIASDPAEKKEKIAKVESSTDKSLRLLEKELQDLKRTNSRNEGTKTPVRTLETLRNRRPQLHTSTPKTRPESEKKSLAAMKSPAPDKKVPERRVLTKENKEPKEAKDSKVISVQAKEEKEKKEEAREKREEVKDKKEEIKEKKEEVKEKETPKSVVKNGTSDKNTPEETVRRSTRPSKIKDYAKMIRDNSQESNDESDDAEDQEYGEVEKTEKPKTRRGSVKTPVSKPAPPPAATPSPAAAPRKRGRPRKDAGLAKIKKQEEEDKEITNKPEKPEPEVCSKPVEPSVEKKESENEVSTPPADTDANNSPSGEQKTPSKETSGGVLMSPTGQTLKKVPIRALPPGIKPLPLPLNARPTMGAQSELCEMQIGKKVVKVQKIVMTKAEVEAMAKKGLVEMKDGTMVLKQGVKLPTSESLSLKSTLVGDKETTKESPSKIEKPTLAQSNLNE